VIDISSTLEAAVSERSRSSIFSVTVEPVSLEMEAIDGLTCSVAVRRLQEGDDYFFATGHDSPDTAIQYKRMTGVTQSSDWDSGWSNLVTSLSTSSVRNHDAFVDGDDILVIYGMDDGTVRGIESDDGGQTWGSDYEIVDTGDSSLDTYMVSIANINTIYFFAYEGIAYNTTIYRASRPSKVGSWSDDGAWDCGSNFIFSYGGYSWQIHAREDANDESDHSLAINAIKGYQEDGWEWSFRTRCKNETWGIVEPVFGGLPTNLDYILSLAGLSRWTNGFMFAGVVEKYIFAADEYGADSVYEFFIARTSDVKSFHMVPTGLSLKSTDEIAGIAEDSGYICIPVARSTDTLVYLTPASSWFGSTPNETELTNDVQNDISIDQSALVAAKTGIAVTDIGGLYNDGALLKGGSILRVSCGYMTAAGEELQQRFTGQITAVADRPGIGGAVAVEALDLFSRATASKSGKPHLLLGQNMFYTDFSDELDIDLFVSQSGVWQIASGTLEATEADKTSMIIAGYDADDAHIVMAKVNAQADITDIKMGLLVHYRTNSDGVAMALLVRYNETSDRVEAYRLNVTNWDYDLIAMSSSPLGWSADTDYWIMATLKHGRLGAHYSTDGISWVEALSDLDASGSAKNLGFNGYAGLYCEIPEGSSSTVRFDNVGIYSMYPPLSGSDIMAYLAGSAGLETDEVMEANDAFPGTSFSSSWDTPGVDGTWSVSGGYAQGYRSSTDPTVLRSDLSATDIVFKATLAVLAEETGIIARADDGITECYAAVVSSTVAEIRKKDTAWSTLFSMPVTLSGTVEVLFCLRGGYLTMFVDGRLLAMAYDTSFSEGYIGLFSDAQVGSPSNHDTFVADGFYNPIDAVIVKPDDTIASIMLQIASKHEHGLFFCNGDGELTFGIFDGTDVDLDARSIMHEIDISRRPDRLLSISRVVGSNAYGESRDGNWGAELLGHKWGYQQDNVLRTRVACLERAEAEVARSQRITDERMSINGHPGLELCDVIQTARVPTGTPFSRRAFSISEVIGSGKYEMSLQNLQDVDSETP